MEQLYDNPGFARRQNISASVLVIVVIYGVFELWRAFSSADGDTTGAMFGVLFVGGGLFGAKTVWDESRDLVAAFAADFAAGRGVVTLWRPFRPFRLELGLDQLTGWRHWVKIGKRNSRSHYLVADAAGYPRPLYFELRLGGSVVDGLRRLAPGAIADFETNSAGKAAAAS
jgi:hypothetical protein